MADITGSQTAHDFPCSRCFKYNKDVESSMRCAECNMNLCQQCVDIHHDFQPMRSHHLSRMFTLVAVQSVRAIDISGTVPRVKRGHEVSAMCCVTPGNTRYTIISSWYEEILIVLDGLFNIVQTVRLSEKSYGVCTLQGSRCVAVTARNGTNLYKFSVQLDGTLVGPNSYQVPKSCRGITSFPETFADSLIVVNGGVCPEDSTKGAINVFSLGSHLTKTKTFPACLNGKDLMPRNIAFSKATHTMFFTDAKVGVLTMGMRGNICILVQDARNTSSSLISGARGLCIDKNDDIYVAGRVSNNVVKYKRDGTLIGEIVNQSHGIKQPISLTFDTERLGMFIGCAGDETRNMFYVDLQQ